MHLMKDDNPLPLPFPAAAINDGVVRVCVECKRVNISAGVWRPVADYTLPAGVRVSHGLCLACCERLYGPYAPCAGEHFAVRFSSDPG